MIKSKKQAYIVVGVFIAVLALFTTTYAFFNYTRTGSSNVIKTGRIAFNAEQGQSINLTNMFPIDVSQGIPNDNTKVGTVTIHVTGDTTYTEGMEYLVKAVNVSNTVGNKTLPISIDVSVTSNTNNDPVTTLGTADADYFTNRGPSASTSIYKKLADETITNNGDILVGYIKSGATGVDGNIIIKAYIDEAKVVISDTYPEENEDTNNDGYIDGTSTSFGEGKTVLTTTEWNSLQQNGVSFQIKVESQEGTWVNAPVPTISSCPGCKYIYTSTPYYYDENNFDNQPISTISSFEENGEQLYNNYNDAIEYDSRPMFLGFQFNEISGILEKAYVCGIKQENPAEGEAFCMEASMNGETYNANRNLITGDSLWNDNDYTAGRCGRFFSDYDQTYYVRCTGGITASLGETGGAGIYNRSGVGCVVNEDGSAWCD